VGLDQACACDQSLTFGQNLAAAQVVFVLQPNARDDILTTRLKRAPDIMQRGLLGQVLANPVASA
jgi:hypothetical protein